MDWKIYAMVGTSIMAALIVITWIYAGKIKKVLGEGIISKMLTLSLLAVVLHTLYIAMDIITNIMDKNYPIANAATRIVMLTVPIPIFYSMVVVKRYSDKLKEMSE